MYAPKIHMKQSINCQLTNTKNTGLKHANYSKAFIEYSNNMDDIYKNIEECNPNKNAKY